MNDDRLVVVGTGHAGVELAFSARKAGWKGTITLLGDEADFPYHRPPLSKGFLNDSVTLAELALRAEDGFVRADMDWRSGVKVLRIDRDRRRVELSDGQSLPYSKLALCTGGRPRPLALPSLQSASPINLLYLRTLADARALRDQLKTPKRIVIIGGGYVGLELAASCRKLGSSVTVLEMAPRLLARVTGAAVAAHHQRMHQAAGVEIRTDFVVEDLELDVEGDIAAVLGSGQRIAADLVLAGIGMLPNVELAEQAGLDVRNGIVVDAQCRTSDAHIFAAGDCTTQLHPRLGWLRVESVPNALEQARIVAAALSEGQPAPRALPWFWSDQYDMKLQMAGLSQDHDDCVLRGEALSGSFTAFYFKDGALVAADAVNCPADFAMAKRLIAAGTQVTPEQLKNTQIPLKTLMC